MNDMRYVGFTNGTMIKRWKGHVKDAFKGSTTDFHKAICENGPDVFDHDVICEGIDSVKDAKFLERHYIEMLNTWGPRGYNMNKGGGGNPNPNEINRQNMRLAKIGRKRAPFTQEHVRNISTGMKGVNIGKKMSLEGLALRKACQIGHKVTCSICGECGHQANNPRHKKVS